MEGIDSIVARRKKARKLRFIIAAIVVLAVVVAIVVPIGLILSKKKPTVKGIASTIIVPLYIYPSATAWDPLYKA
jgi:hypothetical protein